MRNKYYLWPTSRGLFNNGHFEERFYVIARAIVITIVIGFTCSFQASGAGDERYAEILEDSYFGDSAEKIIYLDQNWESTDSLWFYNISLGSNFLPYDIFINLEQKENQALFRGSSNINKYRFLPQRKSSESPNGLPIGFVKNTYLGNDYLGFTCAVCHTAQVNYKGTGIRIDGGPSLADMDGMLRAIEEALLATIYDDDKFRRMAKNISPDPTSARQKLIEVTNKLALYNKINRPSNNNITVHYGYGRLDALGRIYNSVLSYLTPGEETTNYNPPNAPVSYPFLWDTPQHDFVQWNGFATGAMYSPEPRPVTRAEFLGFVERHISEIFGVFASVRLEKQKQNLRYNTSIVRSSLARLEKPLRDLQSPVWPEGILPKIDRELAGKGRELFEVYGCSRCHEGETFVRNDQDRRVMARFFSVDIIGTDPQMAHNAITYKGKSGFFEGQSLFIGSRGRFGEEALALSSLKKMVEGVPTERRSLVTSFNSFFEALFRNPVVHFPSRYTNDILYGELNVNEKDKMRNYLYVYKARPLNGIWATAPYMHNGSVPSLYELLLPSCSDEEIAAGKRCRPNRFTIGSRELDAEKVGFVRRDIKDFPLLFVFDTSLPGNSNVGHEYAAGKTPIIKIDKFERPISNADGSLATNMLPPISDAERWALVEYLKTL